MTPRARQRGVAVLIAMLAVTVGTIIAVNLMWQSTLDLRRAESALASDQGTLYMQGAEAWAADHVGSAARRERIDHHDRVGRVGCVLREGRLEGGRCGSGAEDEAASIHAVLPRLIRA